MYTFRAWKDVLTIVSGKNQRDVECTDGKYPIYGSGGIIGRANSYLCEAETVIVGRKGTIDRPIFVTEPFWNIDTAFGVVAGEKLVPKFLYYFCCIFNFKSLDKSTGRPSLSKSDLLKIQMPVPDYDEQKRIVVKIEELLSQLDEGVETLKKTQEQLEVYRQAVLKDVFEKQIRKYPYHSYALKDLVVNKEGLRRGPFGGSIKKAFFVPSGYKVYEQGNAINNTVNYGHYYISLEKYNEMSSFQVRPYDLLVSCSGTLGRITELPSDAPAGIINQALLRIRLNRNIVSSEYFMAYFRSGSFQRRIIEKSQGSAMANLVGIKEFRETTMNVPEPQYQGEMLAIIDEKLTVCNDIEKTVIQALQQATAMRNSILKRAFEGRL